LEIEATDRLIAGGWQPGCVHSIGEVVDKLEREGFIVTAYMQQFLQAYIGVEYRFPNPVAIGLEDRLVISPMDALAVAGRHFLKMYESTLTSRLTVMGIVSSVAIFMMGEDESTYGGNDRCLYLLGADGEDTFNRLALAKRPVVIPLRANGADDRA
jgi:hypothetical protein